MRGLAIRRSSLIWYVCASNRQTRVTRSMVPLNDQPVVVLTIALTNNNDKTSNDQPLIAWRYQPMLLTVVRRHVAVCADAKQACNILMITRVTNLVTLTWLAIHFDVTWRGKHYMTMLSPNDNNA